MQSPLPSRGPSPTTHREAAPHRAALESPGLCTAEHPQGPGSQGALGKAGLQGVQPSIFRGNSKIKDVAGAEGKQEFFIVSQSIDSKSTNLETFVAFSE